MQCVFEHMFKKDHFTFGLLYRVILFAAGYNSFIFQREQCPFQTGSNLLCLSFDEPGLLNKLRNKNSISIFFYSTSRMSNFDFYHRIYF